MTQALPTVEQVRALLAQMEAKRVEDEKPTATDAFLADLADHRLDPRALHAFIVKVRDALDQLGIDLDAEKPEPAPEAPAPAPVVEPASVEAVASLVPAPATDETPDGAGTVSE